MKKIALVLFAAVAFAFAAHAQLAVQNLRCENLADPIGLGQMQPRFSWQLAAEGRGVLQTAYEIRAAASATDLAPGKNLTWNTGKMASDASVFVPYAGAALQPGKKYWWQVRVWDNKGRASAWSAPASWQMGLLQASDWKAQWIAPAAARDPNGPCPIFRKTFSISKKIASATAYVSARGLYEAHLNGRRIGDAYFTPGWTAYKSRLQYQAYDVTALLQTGKNAVGAMIANGWWSGYIGWANRNGAYGSDIALLFQLDIQYADGTTETIGSDATWRSSEGAVRYSEIYHGETIDARLEKTGWTTAAFDDRDWPAAAVQNLPFDNLVATYNEPVRKQETFQPISIFTTPKGELVADFGQNLVGWVVLKVRGRRGDHVVLQHAEVLDKAGNFYLDNMRAARVTDTLILAGGGEETFEPHFTFHGFRYVKIQGYPGGLKPEHLMAVALYSDMPLAGRFTCSDSLLNQLQHNIEWGLKGNFLDIPTDCPQRDERLGWTGDAQAFSRTAMFNRDAHNFYAKWLRDLALDQLPSGAVPHVIPNVLGNGAAATGWADAATIIPWNVWLAYGDRRVLEAQYPSMKAWVDYMEKNSRDYLWNTGTHWGDWLFYSPAPDDRDGKAAVTDKYLIAQCFFAHSTQLLINTAWVLGKPEDARHYETLLKNVKTAFLNEYVTPNGRLVSGTQTAYVLALQFDMLPQELRPKAVRELVQNIKRYNNHLTTGFLGTPYICHVLSRYGQDSVAYDLLFQKTYPSWLYPVTKGATTIWERWDGIKPDGTFQTPEMNSFNHYAYGAIGDWLYRVVAGLDTEESAPGYREIRIQPHPGPGLTSARAELETPYGRVVSAWNIENESVTLEVEIPANTWATIHFPFLPGVPYQVVFFENTLLNFSPPDESRPGSRELAPGVEWAGRGVVRIGSGRYRFEMNRL